MAKEKKEEKPTSTGLQVAIAQIEKKFGKNALRPLGEEWDATGVEVISSGSIALDVALGVGGYPRGKITEVYGPESSGKTTLCLQAIAEAQNAGGVAAFIDAEHSYDPIYANGIGVDSDKLLFSQPDCGEDALEIVETLVRSGEVDIIVIDSVAALVPRAEIEGEMGDSTMGLHARLMSQACRKLIGIVSKSKTCVIFINQLRMKIGVMFGNPETTTGGKALAFYSSVRVDVRKVESLGEKESPIGNRVKTKIVKNKVAPPHRLAEFNILFGVGIDQFTDLIEMGVSCSIIEKTGSWYSYDGKKIGQGMEGVKETLTANNELFFEIKEKVVKKWI